VVWLRGADPPLSMVTPEQSRPRQILVIDTEGNAFNNPTFKSILDLLLEKGCRIDLRYPTSHAPMPRVAGVRILPYGRLTRKLKAAIFDRLCSWRLAVFVVLVENLLLYQNYDLVIGVDRQGLIEAGILKRLGDTPFVFVSFEIMFEAETSSRYKALERRVSDSASLWIVQDDLRAQQLEAENGLRPACKMILPLASAGLGTPQNDRLRDRLRVPQDKHVAIMMGSIAGWSMAGRILRSVTGWPEDWVLIVHERYGRTRGALGSDLLSIEPLLGRRIFVSEAATEKVDEMSHVLAGVSVGLAFYEPDYKSYHTGRNLAYLGLASGKISTFLRHGIPVILNNIGLYADEALRHGFGRVVVAPEDIGANLDTCLGEDYRSNAQEYFLNKLDFNNFRQQLWSRLSALM
jgi:hypothetical protein